MKQHDVIRFYKNAWKLKIIYILQNVNLCFKQRIFTKKESPVLNEHILRRSGYNKLKQAKL